MRKIPEKFASLHPHTVYGTISSGYTHGGNMNARTTPLIIGLLIGIALGLLYGWVIHPVEPDVATPSSLQEKYQTDLILMIGEAFANENDLDLVHLRLNRLNFHSPETVVERALNFAQAHDFSDQDVQTLRDLHDQLTRPISSTEKSSP